MQPRQTVRNQFQNRRRNLLVAKIDIFGAEGPGDCLIETVLIDKAAIDHRLDDGLAVPIRLIENVLTLRRLKNVLLNKKLGDLFLVHQLTSPSVIEITSSAVVTPARTLRMPSSRRVRMPSSRARWRKFKVELRLLIMCRTSSSRTKISKIPIRPL